MAALSWMTEEFLENILKKSEKDNTIRVTKIDINSAIGVGENYGSSVHRICVEVTRGDESKKYSFIVKTLPVSVPKLTKTLTESEVFLKEITMMRNTLLKMNELLEPGERLSPRHIFSCLKTLTLIMEDLTPLGYRMVDSQKRLDLAHSLLAVKNLAKFHATSLAVCEQEPKHKTLYSTNFYHQNRPEISEMFASGIAYLGKIIADWPELDPKYSEKLIQFGPHLYRKLDQALEPIESEFNVIIHGDYWINNMLFRYDQFGEPTEHILIDFQISIWSSPAADLQYFLNTSLSEDVDLNHRDRLLKEYRRSLLITMKRLGCKTPTPTLQELEKAMRRLEIFGVLATFMVLPMIMLKKNDDLDIQELCDHQNDLPFQNKFYREVLVRRLPEFEKNGVLDT